MIIDQISERIVGDYKSGNQERRVFLQTIKAALLNRQKDLKEKYTEEEETKVLKSELKARQEALEQFRSANREDLAKNNESEIAMLKKMLPEEMPKKEIEKVVKDKINSTDDKSFGNVMREVMIELKGRADGKIVSELVRLNLT
jgi:uncharacterized protein YqeY